MVKINQVLNVKFKHLILSLLVPARLPYSIV